MRPVLAPLLLACCAPALPAQEFRVYTTVSDVTPGGTGKSAGRPVELARSLTLFHAGQAWDHAVEAAEVVRFDPAAASFTILDTRRELTCAVSLEEIARQVKIGRQETEKYLTTLAADPAPGSAGLAKNLAFQLAPRFAVTAGPAPNFFKFAGAPLTYEVACVAPKGPGVSAFYLDYADWTARLNYVLRPGALFPDVRAAVHETLRERGVAPQTVTLTMPDAGPLGAPRTLRAEHVFQETLDARDRELLAEWRGRLAGGAAREVTFLEYLRLTTGGVRTR